MDTPADRLQEARRKAGFSRPIEAIRRFSWERQTYYCHENGTRGLTPETAEKYAKAYKVSSEWLLYGRNAHHDPEFREFTEDYNALEDYQKQAVRDLVRSFRRGHERGRGQTG